MADKLMTDRQFRELTWRLARRCAVAVGPCNARETELRDEAARVLARDRHLAEFRALAVGEASR